LRYYFKKNVPGWKRCPLQGLEPATSPQTPVRSTN
jgi:hypothetical protein